MEGFLCLTQIHKESQLIKFVTCTKTYFPNCDAYLTRKKKMLLMKFIPNTDILKSRESRKKW